MLRLYVTRHGETVWNTEKRMQGWNDSPLTKKGIDQAQQLRGFFHNNIELNGIYTSPSRRTIDTTAGIVGSSTIPIFKDNRLKEIHLGNWEGQRLDQIEQQDKEECHRFWNQPELYQATNGGETFPIVQERVQSFFTDFYNTHQSGTFLAVTHAVVIKLMLTLIKGTSIIELWEPPFIKGGSLTLFEWTDQAQIVFAGQSVESFKRRINK